MWQAWLGTAWFGVVGLCAAGVARHGESWWVGARSGVAWQGVADKAWRGEAGYGLVWCGRHGKVGCGLAWWGLAGEVIIREVLFKTRGGKGDCMSEDVIISLNAYEREYAAWVGGKRMNMAIQDGKKNSRGYRGGAGWNKHVVGALGEIAFCKWAGLWHSPTCNTFKTPDVKVADGSMMIEVKTRTLPDWNLLINPTDSARDLWFALVIGDGETSDFIIKGGFYARNANNDEWISDPGNRNRPVYMVPNDQLVSPEQFKSIISSAFADVCQSNQNSVHPEILEWLPKPEVYG